MQVNVPLMDEDGASAQCSLRVIRSPEGRVQVCKVSVTGAQLGASSDVSKESITKLQNLGFGQICWLPTPEEPQFRITGEGKLVEIRENRASAEPLYVEATAMQELMARLLAG